MRLVMLLLLIVVAATATATMWPARIVEEHETITQVLWNEHDAVVVTGIRRDGWRGSYSALAIELVRGALGAVPVYDGKREWVVVAHITPEGVDKKVEDATTFPLLRPFAGALFRGNNPLLKWDREAFVPVAGDEAGRFQMRTQASTPDYSDVEGWSSRMNLLNQNDLRVEVPLNLDGIRVVVVGERNQDRSEKRVFATFGDGRTVEIISIVERPRFVSAAEYDTLITRR
jgi:hypothetical protein